MVGLTNRSSAQYMLQATGKAVKQWHQSLHYNWQNATPFPFKSNSDGLQPLLFLFHSWKREWNEQTGHNSIQIKWGWITAVKWRSLNQRDTHPCLANDVSSLFIISGICNLESFPKPPSGKGWAGGTAACPPQCPGDHHHHSLGTSHPTRTADCCITHTTSCPPAHPPQPTDHLQHDSKLLFLSSNPYLLCDLNSSLSTKQPGTQYKLHYLPWAVVPNAWGFGSWMAAAPRGSWGCDISSKKLCDWGQRLHEDPGFPTPT